MNIQGKKVLLRAIEETDLEVLHKWANDPEIWHQLGGWHFPGSLNYTKSWFETLKSDKLNQRLAIETPELGLIGTANLLDIDWKNRNAFHGMMLGDKDIRGKGYGIDAVMSIMQYAFDELNLERLDGSIIEYNTISYSFYCGKLGWKEEGKRRNYYFRKGRYWDQVIVGITKADYHELVKQNKYWD